MFIQGQRFVDREKEGRTANERERQNDRHRHTQRDR